MKEPTFIVHPVIGCRSSRFPNSASWNVSRGGGPNAYLLSTRTSSIQGEPERTRKKPTPVLALAILERTLQKDQAQLKKMLDQIASDLPAMSEEERTLVHAYAEQWCDLVQQIVDRT